MDEQLRSAVSRPLGQIPSGCYVLTAAHGELASGLLVSWVQQASFEPPMITVALRQGRPIGTLVEASGCFVLNQIPENPLPLFRHFGRGFDLDQPAFEGLRTEPDPHGVVLRDCPSFLACRVVRWMDCGDHRLYVAEVVGGRSRSDARPYVHLRSSGFNY